MIALPPEETLGRFSGAIERVLGLRFEATNRAHLLDFLERRVAERAGGVDEYLAWLEAGDLPRDEIQALARELTVGETYFFRHMDQFRAFADAALPERAAARASVRSLRILSAGCASGEEAYSLAILARERLSPSLWDVSITGVDVNPAALARASRGSYSSWSLRETPPELRRRWFRPAGAEIALDESIRTAVRFEERNLAEAEPSLWIASSYDVVFCRNVIMYFTPAHARTVVDRIAAALAPGGYLFLGHAETLRGLSQDFHLRHTHDAFYYQRRESLARETSAGGSEPRASMPAADAAVAQLDSGSAWVDAVRAATERIQALSERGAEGADPAGPSPAPAPTGASTGQMSRAIELLERERFSEALSLLAELPAEASRDPDVLLLRAVLLTHSGELAAAEAVCAELRAMEESSAGAHYLIALCREGVGDRARAIEHDRIAAYLDPSFAMPHLHLGLLSRRGGDLVAARRELSEALSLLGREDASRILLFGGGFTREALSHLCRAEIRAAGGEP